MPPQETPAESWAGEWLEPRAGRASGVTVREAVKYLPPEQREHILERYREGRPAVNRRTRTPA